MRKILVISLMAMMLGVPALASATAKQPVIYYTKVVKYTSDPVTDRSYPTFELWREIGTATPTRMLTTGGVGAYPTEFKLSPYHSTIAINYEHTLKLFNVTTKKMTTLATAKYTFANISWSPDGKWLLAMDSDATSNLPGQPYQLRAWRMSDRTERVIRTGTAADFRLSSAGYLFAYYASNTKLLIRIGLGEGFGSSSYVSVANGKVSPAPTYADVTPYTAVSAGQIGYFCNAMDGQAANSFKIVNTTTGVRRGTITSATRGVLVRSISPDGRQVLYSTYSVAATAGNNMDLCPTQPTLSYGLITFPGAIAKKVSQIAPVLASWNAPDTGADVKYLKTGTKIVRDGRTLVTSAKELVLVAQYWR